jgi:hypothetical protein
MVKAECVHVVGTNTLSIAMYVCMHACLCLHIAEHAKQCIVEPGSVVVMREQFQGLNHHA